jgi:hypothetical protein
LIHIKNINSKAMKKVLMLAVMITGMTSYAVAQDAANLPDQSDKGQAVRAVAEGPETGKGKGQLVSETASEMGKTKSSEAKAKGLDQPEVESSNTNANATHGTNVKAVATDQTLTGKEKGQAVKAVATANPKAVRSERTKRPERASRPERAKRPERPKRPATAGRPSVPGRP